MKPDCGCCEGPHISTPAATENRPGLDAISYRAGTYASFFATMQARLSSTDFPELAALKTRDPTDAAMALLDAWAVTGDVLTFYQERYANEGYLGTAIERRSVVELARLIGYEPRPGVSATVYLAYEIDKNATEVEIPAHTRTQSVPGPGEQMQTFETADPLTARFEWNALKPRMSQPPVRSTGSVVKDGLYLQGTATQLKANDALLIDFGVNVQQPYRVSSVEADTAANRTRVTLLPWGGASAAKTLREIARRYGATDRFGVKAESGMAQRVLAVIRPLAEDTALDNAALDSHLEQKVLPVLEEELHAAQAGSFARLEPWIAAMLDEIKRVRHSLARAESKSNAVGAAVANQVGLFGTLVDQLSTPPSVPPRNELRLARDVQAIFGQGAEVFPQLLRTLRPALGNVLYGALANTQVTPPVAIKVYALRAKAALFASNAPSKFIREVHGAGANTVICYEDLNLANAWKGSLPKDTSKGLTLVALDSTYEQIKPDGNTDGQHPEDASYVLIDRPAIKFDPPPGPNISAAAASICPASVPDSGGTLDSDRVFEVHSVAAANTATMAAGMSFTAKVTQLMVAPAWLNDPASQPDIDSLLAAQLLIRGTQVYAQSELLPLAEDPIANNIGDACPDGEHEIELDGLYDGLKPGRWLIIAGQRADVAGTKATPAAELAMLAAVRHGIKQIQPAGGDMTVDLAGDKIHTFITLAQPLAYCYQRDSVALYANVVKANHGETRRETLGGGDGAQAFQQFTLKQPPLTFVAAPTPAGIASTLEVRVNDVRWHEADALLDLGPADRGLMTRRDDDEKTTVVFGDGKHGARLPTGQENIKAIYRNGIGKPGNVRAQQITLATDKPLGVKGVANPLRASGGADRDSRDQARSNAPLAVMALDRLVSVQDYADFARTFAGIGKAAAMRLSDGHRQFVHVTIAGVDDIPIDVDSDLYRNLVEALRRYGDPHLPVQVQTRTVRPLVISAKVAVAPDYPWEIVAPKIRAALSDAFGFDRRELGQDVLKSTVVAAIQRVAGVLYSNVQMSALDEASIIQGLAPREPSTAGGAGVALGIAPRAGSVLTLAPASKAAGPCADSRIPIAIARVVKGKVFPAEIAYLLPDVPDTLLLELQP